MIKPSYARDLSVTQRVFAEALDELLAFASQPGLMAVIREILALPEDVRHLAVHDLLLDRAYLSSMGISLRSDIEITRSHFADQRPTLFCIVKRLPEGYGWKKVTITIDNSAAGVVPSFAVADDHVREILHLSSYDGPTL